MRTATIIVGGLILFGLILAVLRLTGGGGPAAAAKFFIPLWLVCAAFNMVVGVKQAGYSVGEEFPIFLLIFAVPAMVAGLFWWKSTPAP